MDYQYSCDEDGDVNNVPVITLEVLAEPCNTSLPVGNFENGTDQTDGTHFLSAISIEEKPDSDKETSSKAKNDLLEYMIRCDGSVTCKLCGEVLQSRTHWYRHKYKFHATQPLNPTPLFQCELCLVFFKSRKGYIGHLTTRHSEVLSDSSPVLTNSQAELANDINKSVRPPEIKEEPDPEMAIPKTSVPNYQTIASKTTKNTEPKKNYRNCIKPITIDKTEIEEKRSREEKLVADIIKRVKQECEAQGSGGSTKKGYTRRTTVMHS